MSEKGIDMGDSNTERTLGKLLASVDNINTNIDEIKNTLTDHGSKIDHMRSKFDQQKGGWKALAVMSGIAGTIGGFLGKYWSSS